MNLVVVQLILHYTNIKLCFFQQKPCKGDFDCVENTSIWLHKILVIFSRKKTIEQGIDICCSITLQVFCPLSLLHPEERGREKGFSTEGWWVMCYGKRP